MPERVVITGLGTVSPVGTGVDKTWKTLIGGVSGITRLTKVDPDNMASQIAGEVNDFDPADFFDVKEARRLDPYCQYALASADMAFTDAGLKAGDYVPERAGAIIGSGVGGIHTMENAEHILAESGPRRISPFTVPMMIGNMAAGNVSIKYGLKGPNMMIATACATGTHSIGEAFHIIRRGEADLMAAGGTEAPLTELGVSSFCAIKTLSTSNDEPTKASRPFDAKRNGFVISEGCGLVVMESLTNALKRGAKIYAEVAGYGLSADAYHITSPSLDGDGAIRAMNGALKDAGMLPTDIDYINAHGTSTELNDKIETLAIKQVYGDYARKVKISSTKSMTGHLLGAAGGLEAIVCVKVIDDGVIPPTINYENPDPECDLEYVPNKAIKQEVATVMSNSFGFGGQNAVLVFKKYVD